RHAEGLSQVRFPDPTVAHHQNILMSFNKARRSQFEDERTVDFVETPVERIERLAVAKVGFFGAAFDKAISTSLHLITKKNAEKVHGSKVFRACLLGSRGEGIRHSAQAELAQCVVDFVACHGSSPCVMDVKCERYVAIASMSGCLSVSSCAGAAALSESRRFTKRSRNAPTRTAIPHARST